MAPDFWREEYRQFTFPISGPAEYGIDFQNQSAPVVGVSWFEAMAFCKWMNSAEVRRHLRLANGRPWPTGAIIRLPTDAEWERAARWDRKKGWKRFPFGHSGEGEDLRICLAQRCNGDDANLGHTTSGGLFPIGQSACGAMDLAGNVWEWGRSRWVSLGDKKAQTNYNNARGDAEGLDDEEHRVDEQRVLRGGSWFDGDPERLSCSYRDSDHPDVRGSGIGFRCVVVGMGSAPG